MEKLIFSLMLALAMAAPAAWGQYLYVGELTNADLDNPEGLCVVQKANGHTEVWATSTKNGGKVVIYDVTNLNTPVATITTTNAPLAMAYFNGQVYVTMATTTNSLRKYNPETRALVQTLSGIPNSRGIMLMPNGTTYAMTEPGAGDQFCVYNVSNDQLVDCYDAGQNMSSPQGIAHNGTQVTLADSGTDLAYRLNPSGNNWTLDVAIALTNPFGVMYDALGNLFVTYADNLNIYSPALGLLQTLGNGGSGDTFFSDPRSMILVTVNGFTELWAVDKLNDRIARFQGNPPPLPVEWVRFRAQLNGNVAELEWETASEKDNSGFFVQQSRDGKDWIEIGFVPGLGPNGGSYRFEYPLSEYGKYYFRILQRDLDGKEDYTRIETVWYHPPGFAVSDAYPNPMTSQTSIDIFGADEATVEVFDVMGRLLGATTDIPSGTFTLQRGDLPSGNYFLRVTAAGKVAVQQLVIQ